MNLEEAITTILDRMPEEKLTELRNRYITRFMAKMIFDGTVIGATVLEADEVLAALLQEDAETLSLKINNQLVENVPHDCILLIVPDRASGEVGLIAVGAPDLSLDVFQERNKQDTTDQTNP